MRISLALFQAREPISLRRMNQGECGPQVMVGLIPLLRPGCFGGQSLPDRPSLVIPKTPVSRPYHGLIRYDAAIRPDLITGCAQDLQAYFRRGMRRIFRPSLRISHRSTTVSLFPERKAAFGVQSAGKIDKGTIRRRERVQNAGETEEIFKVRIGEKQQAVE